VRHTQANAGDCLRGLIVELHETRAHRATRIARVNIDLRSGRHLNGAIGRSAALHACESLEIVGELAGLALGYASFGAGSRLLATHRFGFRFAAAFAVRPDELFDAGLFGFAAGFAFAFSRGVVARAGFVARFARALAGLARGAGSPSKILSIAG
jgi:hypothetical protein